MLRLPAGINRCLTIVALVAFASTAAAQNVTPQQVDRSIDLAVRYLLGAQLPDGGWPEFNGYPQGVSSLVTLALLNAGLDPDSPAMTRALGYLSERELGKVYSVALQTMAFCAANPNKYAAQIKRNAVWLVTAQLDHGGWGYDQQKQGGDPSNSQFALLALHEAQRAGVDLPTEVWKRVFERARDYWQRLQNENGSFAYTGNQGSGSMTCAGIASLIIVGSQLDALEAQAGEQVTCCGAERSNEDRVQAALRWLGSVFSVSGNPADGHWHLYYIYALERAGRLSGQRFIGKHDWYREGVRQLIGLQDPNLGRITAGRNYQGNEFSETAFSLLFLAKGKRQIVVSRLKFGNSSDWNHHATAIQNLTAHTEQAWKRDLAWQTIDLHRASVADLLESPVLFISATQRPGSLPLKNKG